MFDLLTEARIHRTKTLGELLQIAGDGSEGVGGDEGSTTTGVDVRPQDDGQQPLFGAVEEMPEPVPILVPSRRLCRGLLPVLVGTDVEVDDESITPVQVACNVLLSTRQVTDRLEGARSEGLHLDPVHRGQVDTLLIPG